MTAHSHPPESSQKENQAHNLCHATNPTRAPIFPPLRRRRGGPGRGGAFIQHGLVPPATFCVPTTTFREAKDLLSGTWIVVGLGSQFRGLSLPFHKIPPKIPAIPHIPPKSFFQIPKPQLTDSYSIYSNTEGNCVVQHLIEPQMHSQLNHAHQPDKYMQLVLAVLLFLPCDSVLEYCGIQVCAPGWPEGFAGGVAWAMPA